MTSSAAAREAVIAVCRDDPIRARELADAVPEPLYRAQALAWVARYAPDHDVAATARAAIAAASEAEDAYLQTTAAAWPLRALLERGHRDEALALCELVLPAMARVTPPASRAEALLLLFQAMFDAGPEIRRAIAFALVETHDHTPHWRSERALLEIVAMLKSVDPEFARRLAVGKNEAEQRRLDRALAGEVRSPRVFFW